MEWAAAVVLAGRAVVGRAVQIISQHLTVEMVAQEEMGPQESKD